MENLKIKCYNLNLWTSETGCVIIFGPIMCPNTLIIGIAIDNENSVALY